MIANKDLIEERFKESIDRYVERRISTGSFLEAVLSNDLKEAIGRADTEALANLPHIVSYLYNDCPSLCWGNKTKVQQWLNGTEEY